MNYKSFINIIRKATSLCIYELEEKLIDSSVTGELESLYDLEDYLRNLDNIDNKEFGLLISNFPCLIDYLDEDVKVLV